MTARVLPLLSRFRVRARAGSSRAFTLIELLIVIFIIGLLAAILIVAVMPLIAAAKVAACAQSIELIDLRTIYPLDTETIVNSVRKTGRAVIVHEAPKTAGLGAEVASRIMEHCFLYLEAPIQRVTGFDTVMPYYKLELEYLPEAERIRKAIHEVAAY